MTRRKVLIVEDDGDIARLVALHLRDLQCECEICGDGALAMERARGEQYDLVVLDLMLPGLDGLSVCTGLRRQGRRLPILMLTAKSSETDRVIGLELGADDYLTKPFSVGELVARVKALFRRVEQFGPPAPAVAGEPGLIERGALRIDAERHQATRDGETLPLTAKEFELLLHFARHPGRVYTRLQLLEQVWGTSHEGYEHTVNTHINRLRNKLEPDPAKPTFLLTVWGVGYKFAENP
jgi:two-component system OmpR family response regulator